MIDDREARMSGPITRSDRETRECVANALEEARSLVRLREKDIRRCLDDGLAWEHPKVRTHRSRLAAALADVQILELMVRPTDGAPSITDILPLTVRR